MLGKKITSSIILKKTGVSELERKEKKIKPQNSHDVKQRKLYFIIDENQK